MFDSNEPHAAAFPAPSNELPKKAGSAIFGVGSYPEKDVEGWLRRMCILRCGAGDSYKYVSYPGKGRIVEEVQALLITLVTGRTCSSTDHARVGPSARTQMAHTAKIS